MADHARLLYLVLELEANGVEIVYTEIVNETMKSNLYQHQQQQQQQQQAEVITK